MKIRSNAREGDYTLPKNDREKLLGCGIYEIVENARKLYEQLDYLNSLESEGKYEKLIDEILVEGVNDRLQDLLNDYRLKQ